jgi:predicted CxxxxCH...CXXCH cytochrome family protein
MTCGDCHASPPAGHFAGGCTGCHSEVNATGTAFLSKATLHANGHVDLGDGSGKCGACHGKGNDPWPSTNAHPAHEKPSSAMAAPCASCHVVPSAFGAGTPHPRGGPPTVTLAGLAVTRETPATYAAGSCREVYCHGGGLEGTVAATPAWTDTSGTARKCGACHGTPPAAPHVASPACDLCHRDGVVTPSGAAIAPAWSVLHVNGVVDRGGN